jgi:hypothetical protein
MIARVPSSKDMDDVKQLRLQRKNDKFIMDEFISAGCQGTMLKELNECRMFLHAVTLSDIASADGCQISINAWNGSQDNRGGSQYQWPRTQKVLPSKHWEQWWCVTKKVFLLRCTPRSLKEQLLTWNKGAPSKWKWYFCPKEHQLYAKEGTIWRVYCRHWGRMSQRQGRSKYLQ